VAAPPQLETAALPVASIELIPAPRGFAFDEPAYIPSTGRIAFVRFGIRLSEDVLFTVDPRGKGTPRRLRLPGIRGCTAVARQTPVWLPNRKLGFLSSCLGNAARFPDRVGTLDEYDPRTGRTTRLVPYSLPASSGRFSYGPGMKGGLIFTGALKRLGARRLLPTRTGVPGAGNPAWSPDGRSIALVSGPPDGPVEGPYGIYLAASPRGPARRLVGGLDSVGPLAWSPDSRWLVGEVDPPDGPDGLWLVDATTGKLSLVVAGDDFGSATWLPDGRTIVVGTGIYAYVPGAAPGSRPGLEVIELASLPG